MKIKTLEDFASLTATQTLIKFQYEMVHKYPVTDVEVYRAVMDEFWWEFEIVDTHIYDWGPDDNEPQDIDLLRFMLFDVLCGLLRARGLWFKQFSAPGAYRYAGRPEDDPDKKKISLSDVPGFAV